MARKIEKIVSHHHTQVLEAKAAQAKLLDLAYIKFMETNGEVTRWLKGYQSVSRRASNSRRFEEWLFDQGASIKQEHAVRYIQFQDDDQELMFMLRWL